ncbi:MAG: hypothetical protein R6U96_16225 [Promethearchaeia archaeon]
MRVLEDQKKLIEDVALSEVDSLPVSLPRVLHIQGMGFGDHTYIIESPHALQILLNPWVVGLRLAELARKSSASFLEIAFHLCPEVRHVAYNNVAEVIPLAGALYYHIGQAFEQVFHESLKQCFIGARRTLDEAQDQWITELSYLNFEALPPNPIILLGDTIATGGTIQQIIKTTISHTQDPQAIVLYSIAGSVLGAYKLHQLERELNVPIYSFFSNALFGVAPNGTDMPWFHPVTVMSSEIRQKAMQTYGPELGKAWCAVWDWGERAKDPQKHLRDILSRINLYLDDSDYSEHWDTLEMMKKKVEDSMENRLAPLKL